MSSHPARRGHQGECHDTVLRRALTHDDQVLMPPSGPYPSYTKAMAVHVRAKELEPFPSHAPQSLTQPCHADVLLRLANQ
jgi:hypothetical protein